MGAFFIPKIKTEEATFMPKKPHTPGRFAPAPVNPLWRSGRSCHAGVDGKRQGKQSSYPCKLPGTERKSDMD